jgi:hypothetical protein
VVVLSQTVQFLSRSTLFATGGGMDTGSPNDAPPLVDRLMNTVGTTRVLNSSGIEDTNQVWCFASNATLASLTRSKLPPLASGCPEVAVSPGKKPGRLQLAPPFVERTTPISVAPPLKNLPT